MSDEIFYIKTGDTAPALEYELHPRTVDLTGASVVFNLKDREGNVVVSRGTGQVLTATTRPKVGYPWQAGDTAGAGAGRFYGEFEVTFADGSVGTFPGDDFIDVRITDDIA